MLKFDASIFGGELPVGLGVVGIAPTFRLGVNDARAGRPPHPDYDLWSTNAQWNYERGRAWGVFAPRDLPLQIGGKLNEKAVSFFRQCGEAIL